MDITFLKPTDKRIRLGKSIRIDKLGGLIVAKEAGVKCTFHDREVHTIHSLQEFLPLLQLKRYANEYLIQGEYRTEATTGLRRKRAALHDNIEYVYDRPSKLFIIDIDKFDGTLEEFISLLPKPFHKAAYIWHTSSSSGLVDSKLNGHLYFWLEMPATIEDMRRVVKAIDIGSSLDERIYRPEHPIHTTEAYVTDGDGEVIVTPEEERYSYKEGGEVNLEHLPMGRSYNNDTARFHRASQVEPRPDYIISLHSLKEDADLLESRIGDTENIYYPSYIWAAAMLYQGAGFEKVVEKLEDKFRETNGQHQPREARGRVQYAKKAIKKAVELEERAGLLQDRAKAEVIAEGGRPRDWRLTQADRDRQAKARESLPHIYDNIEGITIIKASASIGKTHASVEAAIRNNDYMNRKIIVFRDVAKVLEESAKWGIPNVTGWREELCMASDFLMPYLQETKDAGLSISGMCYCCEHNQECRYKKQVDIMDSAQVLFTTNEYEELVLGPHMRKMEKYGVHTWTHFDENINLIHIENISTEYMVLTLNRLMLTIEDTELKAIVREIAEEARELFFDIKKQRPKLNDLRVTSSRNEMEFGHCSIVYRDGSTLADFRERVGGLIRAEKLKNKHSVGLQEGKKKSNCAAAIRALETMGEETHIRVNFDGRVSFVHSKKRKMPKVWSCGTATPNTFQLEAMYPEYELRDLGVRVPEHIKLYKTGAKIGKTGLYQKRGKDIFDRDTIPIFEHPLYTYDSVCIRNADREGKNTLKEYSKKLSCHDLTIGHAIGTDAHRERVGIMLSRYLLPYHVPVSDMIACGIPLTTENVRDYKRYLEGSVNYQALMRCAYGPAFFLNGCEADDVGFFGGIVDNAKHFEMIKRKPEKGTIRTVEGKKGDKQRTSLTYIMDRWKSEGDFGVTSSELARHFGWDMRNTRRTFSTICELIVGADVGFIGSRLSPKGALVKVLEVCGASKVL